MFRITESSFGSIPSAEIASPDGSVRARILTGYGAALQELVLKNPMGASRSVICGFASPDVVAEEGAVRYWGTVLFPFVNRIKDGAYSFGGKSYSLPTNEAGRGHALHGLVFDKPFSVKDKHEEEDQATLVLECSIGAGEHPGYPFAVSLEMRFTLSEKEGLACKATLTNRGIEQAPVGFGVHPYYTTGTPIDEVLFRLPPCREVDCDPQSLIPTGDYKDFSEYTEYKKLGHTFDSNFELTTQSGRQEVVLMDTHNKVSLHVWQGTGTSGLNYLQIYTLPDRSCIAIEPMSCEVDAFNSGRGLTVLEGGACAEYSYGVYLN